MQEVPINSLLEVERGPNTTRSWDGPGSDRPSTSPKHPRNRRISQSARHSWILLGGARHGFGVSQSTGTASNARTTPYNYLPLVGPYNIISNHVFLYVHLSYRDRPGPAANPVRTSRSRSGISRATSCSPSQGAERNPRNPLLTPLLSVPRSTGTGGETGGNLTQRKQRRGVFWGDPPKRGSQSWKGHLLEVLIRFWCREKYGGSARMKYAARNARSVFVFG